MLDAERQREMVAELKRSQLEHWRLERLGDGEVLLRRHAQSEPAHDALTAQPKPESVAFVQSWLAGYISAYQQYDRAYLFAADGTLRLAVTADASAPSTTLVAEARETVRTRKVRLVDFYRDETDGDRPFLAITAPVLDGTSDRPALGAIVLRINPFNFVYRILAIEDGGNTTGETVLLRRDGPSNVLVLNPRRLAPDSALRLRPAITDPERLEAKAVGGGGMAAGPDFRGVEVLGFAAPIRDSPWFIVSRIDRAELLADLRVHLWPVSSGVVLLIVSSVAVATLWRYDQRMRGYQKRAELSAALRESEERLRPAMISARQGFWDFDIARARR